MHFFSVQFISLALSWKAGTAPLPRRELRGARGAAARPGHATNRLPPAARAEPARRLSAPVGL